MSQCVWVLSDSIFGGGVDSVAPPQYGGIWRLEVTNAVSIEPLALANPLPENSAGVASETGN